MITTNEPDAGANVLDITLQEAKRLHEIGFACIWLKPKQKVPIEMGWTKGPREGWESLRGKYRRGMNVGVRLGLASKIGNCYLAVLDCDVKSIEPHHAEQMRGKLAELFPYLPTDTARVTSGRGNGSGHIYVVTAEPAAKKLLAQSAEKVKVKFGLAAINAPSKKDVEALTAEELKEGWRLRPAWEISLMGQGSQTVLPPSIHPDSNLRYTWAIRLTDSGLSLPEIKAAAAAEASDGQTGPVLEDFKAVDVDLEGSQLDEATKRLVINGEGCTDGSDSLYFAAKAMVRCGFNDDQILTVLTDEQYYLGAVPYAHARTRSRDKAAKWLYRYTVAKARTEADAKLDFDLAVEYVELKSEAEIKAQLTELVPWQTSLTRTSKRENAGVKKSVVNIVKILENEVGSSVFRYDEFADRRIYGCDAPWSLFDAGIGDQQIDPHVADIIYWLSKSEHHVEPPSQMVYDAMSVISRKNVFHPVRDWLKTLTWDGRKRLDTWLVNHFSVRPSIGGEFWQLYYAAIFRKWMVASVTRVFNPGTKFDWMILFEGAQGIGKSIFGSILFGADYFSDRLENLRDRDAALGLRGKLCVEFAELDALNKHDAETAKAFISRPVDHVRPLFGKFHIDVPRQCVMFGSTNGEFYLKDKTGNRRYNIAEVGELDIDCLKAEREQLWAEAMHIYAHGLEPQLWIDEKSGIGKYAKRLQQAKLVPDDSAMIADKLMDFIATERAKPIEDRNFNFNKFKIQRFFEFEPLGKMRETPQTIQACAWALRNLHLRGPNLIVTRSRSNSGSEWSIKFENDFLD